MNGLFIEARHGRLVTARIASFVSVFLFVFASIIFTGGCRENVGQLPLLYEETDWQRMGLHGKVKTWTMYEVTWEETFGRLKIASPATIDQSTVFLETGNQSESIYYDMNGKPKWKDVFIYATNDETWMEAVSYRYVSTGATSTLPRSSYTNSYDENGRLSKVEGFNYDDAGQKLSPASWVHIYEYLKDEGKIVRSSYDSKGALQWKNISQYNAEAKESASTHYDNNGIMQWSDKFEYDSKGNKAAWARYDSKGSLRWRDEFKYDPDGNEAECSNYDYGNKLMWKNLYRYISEDDLEQLDVNRIADTKNQFDQHGNWMVKVTLEEKKGFGGTFLKVKEIQKRAITYFP